MKRLLLFTAALLIFCGCKKENNEVNMTPVVDKISIAPGEESFMSRGGSTEVVVTSSGDWKLSGGAEWVEASPLEGKDGDKVVFQVKPNGTLEELSTAFTFTVGEHTFELPVTCKATEYLLKLTSGKEVSVPQDGQQIEVVLDSSDSHRDLTYTISPEAQSWLSHNVTLPGENGKGAKMYFTAAENLTFEGRTATITIKGTQEAPTVEVQVSQPQKDHITTEKQEFDVGLEGGALDIPVTANVAYEVKTSAGWITYSGKQGDVEHFMIERSDSRREGTITFTGGSTSLVVKVTQKKQPLIMWVADMQGNWAGPTEWKNPAVLNNLSQFTFEATVNFSSFRSGTGISTIMGIEDYFLVRMGDGNKVSSKKIEVAYRNGAVVAQNEFVPFQMVNKWSHLAVTFDKGQVSIYINGLQIGSGSIPFLKSANFGAPRSRPDARNNRLFWVGYSFDANRDFQGKMSEVRIWNKVLTPQEMKATNHQYQVDPASAGLVAYWRFNDGQGNTIKDHTVNGNDLMLQKSPKWVSVSLP